LPDSTARAHAAARSGPRWAFALSGVIPLFGLLQRPRQTALLIYTIFAGVMLCRPWLARAARHCRLPSWLCFTLLLWAAGLVSEGLAWTNEHLAGKAEPALFHPQMGPDLLLVSGMFFGWAAAWLLAARWYRYSLWDVFATTGILGVLIEQNGVVLREVIAGLAVNPAQSAIMVLFVFALYGSVPGTAYALLHWRLQDAPRRGWLRLPLALALLFVGGKAGAFIVRLCADALGLVPAPRPM
jgi:hypothetical protein